MQRIITKYQPRLLFINQASFSKMLLNPASNPIKERVMSTPTWPIPYYQRLAKAYPVRLEKQNVNLSVADCAAGDFNWMRAKQTLNKSLKGRHIVEYTENNLNTKTYLIKKEDCESMVRAYVDDIGQFLDLANKQNVRILGGKSLI